MRNNLLDQEIRERLLSYINGELDEEERLSVESWLRNKPENREAFRLLEKDCLFIRWAGREREVNVGKRKTILLQEIRRGRIRKISFRIAATVALLMTLGGMYLFVSSPTHEKMLAKNESVIRHAYPQAKLILSTGKEIDLTKNAGHIQEQDGSVVALDSNKMLVYDGAQVIESKKTLYNKIIVPRGGEFFLTLSDGTEVWLNADSELEYPVNFVADERAVKLRGEAYFKVKKDTTKPFRVTSGEYRLQVYGTEFNMNTYHQEEIQVVLVQGAVGFRANLSTPELRLKPNQLGVANELTGKTEIKEVDVYPYIAWKNQDVVVMNERLESIMEKIERWYDVNVFFQNDSLKDVRLYGNIQRYADIQDLLFFLEKTSGAHFSIKDRTIIINNK